MSVVKEKEKEVDYAIKRYCASPWPLWTQSACIAAALPLAGRTGFPTAIIAASIPVPIATAGFVIRSGDAENGAGIGSAWSLIYLVVNGKKAVLSRSPLPLALTTLVAVNAGLYSYRYFALT